MRRLVLQTLALAALPATGQSEASPDGRLTARHDVGPEEALTLAVDRDGASLQLASRLGIVLDDGRRLDRGLRLVGITTAARDTPWETIWGERRFVCGAHREIATIVESADGLRMIVRRFGGRKASPSLWTDEASRLETSPDTVAL